MLINRRAVLRLMTAGGASLALPYRVHGAEGGATQLLLLIDDLSPTLSVERMRMILEPLVAAQIPVGLILRPWSEIEVAHARLSGLSDFLRTFLIEYKGLGEVVAWAPGLADLKPYAQMRLATKVRAGIERALGLNTREERELTAPVTIACQMPEEPGSMDAIRAAGFRNVLLLTETDQKSESVLCYSNAVCINKSNKIGLISSSDDFYNETTFTGNGGGISQVVLSLSDAVKISELELLNSARSLAGSIASAIAAQRAFAALPQEHLYWFGGFSTRNLALRVEPPRTSSAAEQIAFDGFLQSLKAEGITYSLAIAEPEAPEECLLIGSTVEPGAAVGKRMLGPITDPVCGVTVTVDPPDDDMLMAAGLSVVLHASDTEEVGVDHNGLLHLRESSQRLNTTPGAEALRRLLQSGDLSVVLTPEAYSTPAAQAASLKALRALAADSAIKISSLPEMAKSILPADPAYQIMLATRRDLPATLARPGDLSAGSDADWMQDAAIAWDYFKETSDPRTGLCPATVFGSGRNSSTYHRMTMWDLGSLLLAVVSAHDLGLIDDAEYVRRVELIIKSLPNGKIGGLQLPGSEVHVSTLRASRSEFNSTDAGRLLLALKIVNDRAATKGIAEPAVAAWQIAETLDAGHPRSVERGRLVDARVSQYAHYTALGYRLWQIATLSPYEDLQGESETDRRMDLLYRVAEIGSLGTEPTLLEAVELGLSAPSDYLADVLLTAQQRGHARDGLLYCVSEGPIDRSPWFTFQGLRVDDGENPWSVLSRSNARKFKTQEFRDAALLVSTKAAFLWAAVRPCDYSNRLLAFVRERGKTKGGGYASGIYAASGKPTENYRDVNSNGIILQAIAYRMGSRKPQIGG